MSIQPAIEAFFDPYTSSVQYVVADPSSSRCAIIDPVLDFDVNSGTTATVNVSRILEFIKNENLVIEWILDTHTHADHISAAAYLKNMTSAPIAIGNKVIDVQRLWSGYYNLPRLMVDGSQWDYLFSDGEQFRIGNIPAYAVWSPGHTSASFTYVIGNAAFIHDTLYMPDVGTARADFPGGNAKSLWRSIQRILAMSKDTRLFTGHDYQPGGRPPRWESSPQEQIDRNIHLTAAGSEEDFIRLREERDRTLALPRLMLHALQVNINGGMLPAPEENGRRYLKIPVDSMRAWSFD